MLDAPVLALIHLVRRRLWIGECMAAARRAGWISAALMGLIVAVHLVVHAVAVEAVPIMLVAVWVAHAMWVAARRPSDRACALWADRFLGGSSAYTTLFDLRTSAEVAESSPAFSWLRRWAVQAVPDAMRRLAERREPDRLGKPIAAMLVCAALAAGVLALPGGEPGLPHQAAAASVAMAAVDAPPLLAETPPSSQRVRDIGAALRGAPPLPANEQRAGSGAARSAAAAGSDARLGHAQGSPAVQAAAAKPQDGHPAPTVPSDAVAPAATGRAAGSGSGREAGTSRDERADVGVSRVAPAGRTVPRSTMPARSLPTELRADDTQAASYDDGRSPLALAPAGASPDPAAATPPPATQSLGLTPSEASYVQAWLKAGRPDR